MGFHYRIYNNRRAHYLSIFVINKADIFNNEELKMCIVESLKFCQEKKGLKIYGWCLLPNALHLIAESPPERELSGIIRDFKTYTSKNTVKLLLSSEENRSGILNSFKKAASKNRKRIEYKLWMDGYYPIELFSPELVSLKLFEMHGYPVQTGLVYRKFDYRFSSARNYNGMPALLDIIKIDELLNRL